MGFIGFIMIGFVFLSRQTAGFWVSFMFFAISMCLYLVCSIDNEFSFRIFASLSKLSLTKHFLLGGKNHNFDENGSPNVLYNIFLQKERQNLRLLLSSSPFCK